MYVCVYMTTSMVFSLTTPPNLSILLNPQFRPSVPSISISNPNPNPNPRQKRKALRFALSGATKPPSGPVRKPPANKKRKKKAGRGSGRGMNLDDLENDLVMEEDGLDVYQPLPKPPAGFIVDDLGRVLMISNKRITTIVDPVKNCPLECVIRRVFRSSRGKECMLLYPVDMPVMILKSTNIDGWSAVSDEEFEAILPTAEYALAKIHIHLVHSGFCYTARGGFCYTEDDIFEFLTDEDGQEVDALLTEGVEITCFHLDGSHYMIYTPSNPLFFVAVKDQNGQLQLVDDELSEDPCVLSAIDEETEFNALVEEEAALIDTLLGKT
ncbi:uncharacterized protein LOC130778240 isoform X2 [Actinidia eriantha]|uniref:uncharacterized protein LOC130778240 isoform X2 n=1 Tax=Actinidia eriantha TaxID=165200 RepID=UPI002584647E|nr:uncharacterized protein LOC130778240 isoform X2 [Actinidia eriantha]